MRLLVTRENYFHAAMEILASDGAGQLKISVLCKAIGVTSGSFYGYFGSFDGFVEEFLAHWQESQTERVYRASTAPSDPIQRIHLIKELASALPHEAEAAIRSWAHTNSRVAEAQKRVDDRRVKVLIDLILPAVGNRREAKKLAAMAMSLLVGIQQWRSPVTKRDFNEVFDEFERLLLSRAAATPVAG